MRYLHLYFYLARNFDLLHNFPSFNNPTSPLKNNIIFELTKTIYPKNKEK